MSTIVKIIRHSVHINASKRGMVDAFKTPKLLVKFDANREFSRQPRIEQAPTKALNKVNLLSGPKYFFNILPTGKPKDPYDRVSKILPKITIFRFN